MKHPHQHKWPLDCACGAEAGTIIAELEQRFSAMMQKQAEMQVLLAKFARIDNNHFTTLEEFRAVHVNCKSQDYSGESPMINLVGERF